MVIRISGLKFYRPISDCKTKSNSDSHILVDLKSIVYNSGLTCWSTKNRSKNHLKLDSIFLQFLSARNRFLFHSLSKNSYTLPLIYRRGDLPNPTIESKKDIEIRIFIIGIEWELENLIPIQEENSIWSVKKENWRISSYLRRSSNGVENSWISFRPGW